MSDLIYWTTREILYIFTIDKKNMCIIYNMNPRKTLLILLYLSKLMWIKNISSEI